MDALRAFYAVLFDPPVYQLGFDFRESADESFENMIALPSLGFNIDVIKALEVPVRQMTQRTEIVLAASVGDVVLHEAARHEHAPDFVEHVNPTLGRDVFKEVLREYVINRAFW